MRDLIKNLFESYLDNIEPNSESITTAAFQLLQFHRIEMILADYAHKLILLTEEDKLKLLEKKDRIKYKNKKYLEEVAILSKVFQRESIDYILLKGITLIYDCYKQPHHRYFSDIDIFVDSNKIESVENILYKQGYVQGDIINNKIVKVSRKEIVYQKMHTHEIYQMIKMTDKNLGIIVDINFLFSWRGVKKSEVNFVFSEFFEETSIACFDDVNLVVFNNELQFIHLCVHFYNEAMFFALDQGYVNGKDTKELLLFRLLDILLITKKKINIKKIYSLSIKLCVIDEIEYVLSLINFVMGSSYIASFSNYFKITEEVPNSFCSKNGEIIQWPISIEQRLFDPNAKKKAIEQLFEKGYI